MWNNNLITLLFIGHTIQNLRKRQEIVNPCLHCIQHQTKSLRCFLLQVVEGPRVMSVNGYAAGAAQSPRVLSSTRRISTPPRSPRPVTDVLASSGSGMFTGISHYLPPSFSEGGRPYASRPLDPGDVGALTGGESASPSPVRPAAAGRFARPRLARSPETLGSGGSAGGSGGGGGGGSVDGRASTIYASVAGDGSPSRGDRSDMSRNTSFDSRHPASFKTARSVSFDTGGSASLGASRAASPEPDRGASFETARGSSFESGAGGERRAPPIAFLGTSSDEGSDGEGDGDGGSGGYANATEIVDSLDGYAMTGVVCAAEPPAESPTSAALLAAGLGSAGAAAAAASPGTPPGGGWGDEDDADDRNVDYTAAGNLNP